VYLIAEEKDVDTAVRALVRIGIDNVEGYATPDALMAYDETHGKLQSIEEVKFESVKTHLLRGDAAVVDVRGAAEHAPAHVPGALNVAHTRLALRSGELPSDKKLLIHCETGARASSAASFLSRKGFHVAIVNDEFVNWPLIGTVESNETVAAGA
jgi:hydroxyacylglutathione hydrolase